MIGKNGTIMRIDSELDELLEQMSRELKISKRKASLLLAKENKGRIFRKNEIF